MDALQCNRFSSTKSDYRIAAGVAGQSSLGIAETRNVGETQQIDLVCRYIEIVDRVVADRLRENELVVPARASQRIIAREGEDRHTLRVSLNVVGNYCRSDAAVSVGPGLGHVEHHRAGVGGGSRDRQRAEVAGLDVQRALPRV